MACPAPTRRRRCASVSRRWRPTSNISPISSTGRKAGCAASSAGDRRQHRAQILRRRIGRRRPRWSRSAANCAYENSRVDAAAEKLAAQADWLTDPARCATPPLALVSRADGGEGMFRFDMPMVTPSNDFYDVIHTSPIVQFQGAAVARARLHRRVCTASRRDAEASATNRRLSRRQGAAQRRAHRGISRDDSCTGAISASTARRSTPSCGEGSATSTGCARRSGIARRRRSTAI